VRAMPIALACAGVLWPRPAAAEPAQAGRVATASAAPAVPLASQAQRILLLRVSASVRTPLVARTERALAEALSARGVLVTTSPLSFHDAQLVAGCSGTLRACGSQVAMVLDSEELAVAQLEHEAPGSVPELQLFLFGGGGAARHASVPLLASGEPLEASVRDLVRQVLGGGESPAVAPAQAASATAAPAAPIASPQARTASAQPDAIPSRRRERTLKAVGAATLGIGGALLGGALATSIAARDAEQAYARSEVSSPEDADRALASYETAERRADAARVLWGVGAATAATGTFLLLWQRYAGSKDRNLQSASARGRRVQWGAVPVATGVSLALSGELR
jgi:hypothetical protein